MSAAEADRHESYARELRAAELPREVLDSLLEGCQVIDRDFRYLYVNDAVCKQGRQQREALLGRTMMECYPGIEDTPMFAELRRCMRERAHGSMDNEFEFENGARAVFELRFVPVPRGLCVFSLDVTERRELVAAIVGDSDDAIIGTKLDGTITTWNPAASLMLGWTREEALGRPASILIPPDGQQTEQERWARISKGERLEHFFASRLAKDGALVEVSITLSPVRNAEGRVVGISKIMRDMREVRARERELVHAKEAAETAQRELESFSYSVAHDLRAPLRSIDGFSQALLEDCEGQLDETGRRHLQQVRESAQLMAELIDDILALSRVTRHTLVREEVSITKEASAILARLAMRDAGRVVVTTVAPGLVVLGDRKLIAILLENLLGNAWKFTSKRAVAHIEVGVEQIDQERVFFVKDDGAGFDMTYAHKLFGVFSRLHSSSEFEGTGVGLATVQRIVSRHRGRVWGRGAPGDGACFRFTLEAPTAR
ncbi:MAG: PAS domain-containing protein [Sandaracinaceae bacterium]|nr:PAS domain-containing protein [Sandaracinaceae bacterium]